MSASTTARARARAEITREIKEIARRHVAEQGAASLSLRAVARELGMVSSAVYRYYASRDELLTALIIDAYDSIGAAAEQADAGCARGDLTGRWRAVCGAVRTWAHTNPHEYALVYGTPVPGYVAPQDTIGHATRITAVLAALLVEAAAGDRFDPVQDGLSAIGDETLRAAVHTGVVVAVPGVAPRAVVRGLLAWTQLFGIVSFELFGHLVGVVQDADAFFALTVDQMAASIGLPPSAAG